MKTLFDQSFCVLLTYKMLEASSGIFGHAVTAKKIIIGSSYGLLGELINDYELGITIDKIGGKSIAESKKRASRIINENIVMTNYRLLNTSLDFSRTIFSK
ncbi:MAG: hypothetical protein FWF54_07325 [Candidatus Azobacteroides sp.]|nr:hypothetical protein [Candidatus Azobacteroides sp.]